MATFSQVIEAAIEVAVKRAALAAHPVGSIIITNDPRNPSQYIGGGGTLVSDKVMIGAGGVYTVGQEIGQSSVQFTPEGTIEGTAITVDQMPSHTHTQTSCDTQGAHTHGRGTQNITGSISTAIYVLKTPVGAFTLSAGSSSATLQGKESTHDCILGFTASNNWSGASDSKGGHSHTITLNDTGSGQAHDHEFTGTETTIETLPPSRTAFFWRRTS